MKIRKYRVGMKIWGVLFLCLLLAGTCYAKWGKELRIQADVTSGAFNYKLPDQKEAYETGWKDEENPDRLFVDMVKADAAENDSIQLQLKETVPMAVLPALCEGRQITLQYPILAQEANTFDHITCDTTVNQITLHCKGAVVCAGEQQIGLDLEQYAVFAPDLTLSVETEMCPDAQDKICQTFTLTPESRMQWEQAMQQKLPAEWNEQLAGQPAALQMEYELNWNLSLQQQVEQTLVERIFSCTYAYWIHTFTLNGVWNLAREIEAEAEVVPQPEPDSVKQPEVLQEIEEQSDTEMQQKAGKVIGNEKQSEAETSSEHRKQQKAGRVNEHKKQPGAEDVAIEEGTSTEEVPSTDVLSSGEKE